MENLVPFSSIIKLQFLPKIKYTYFKYASFGLIKSSTATPNITIKPAQK